MTRLERFLANPPLRIRPDVVQRRKMASARKAIQRSWAQSMFDKQSGKCFYCGVVMTRRGKRGMTIDHVVPLSKGGTNSRKNLVAACSDCNQRKGDLDAETYLKNLAMRRREWAVWEARMARGLPCRMPGRDSDGSPKGGDGEAGSVRSTTARAEGIARMKS